MRQKMAAAFVWMNGVLLVAALVGWPLTQFTVARHEPAFVLGLSWMAIILACWGNLLTATVKRDTTGD